MSAQTKARKYFGSHISGGWDLAIKGAKDLGVNTIQIHPSAPQRWNRSPFKKEVEEKFISERDGSGVEKVFFHGIYLINLASPDLSKRELATTSLVYYLETNARIDGNGVIFHVGSLKDEPLKDIGYKRAAEIINLVFHKAKGKGRLLLENAAGSGKVIGDRLSELRAIYDLVDDKSRLGFALDTQHAWASGYNLKDDLDGFVKECKTILELEKIWAIHINDSKSALNSRVDRHENIGEGTIGSSALRNFFLHEAFAEIPFILETPNVKDLDSASQEVAKLRKFLED